MKHLYLVRHAKSSWKEQGKSDFERSLNDRGRRELSTIRERIKEEVKVELVLSSSSKRTTETCLSLAESMKMDSDKISLLDELYHATPNIALQVINKLDNNKDAVMLVGHNPWVSQLCGELCDCVIEFPTLGIAKISFDTKDWSEIFYKTGTLESFDYPNNRN